MNSRERVRIALDHQEPDRVPFDLGGTNVTGIHRSAYRALRERLGLPPSTIEIANLNQQLARVEDDVLDRLGADVKMIVPQPATPITFQDRDDDTVFYDEFRIGRRMPKDNGLYYDMFEHPLRGRITMTEVETFRLPDPLQPVRFAAMKKQAEQVALREQRAVVVGDICAGVLEVFEWLRGFEDAYSDLALNPELAGAMMDRLLELKLAYWGKVLELLGDLIDVAALSDDFAGQNGLLISPRVYRTLLKPRHKQLCDFIHRHSRAKTFFHTCGSVRAVIPDLIESGFDILNPVQVSAAGMDTAELKREFGRDLVFWGGGVDTQNLLGLGTPQQVREEVKRRLSDLMPGGGFVFATVHNIQANVPPENILAMWETVQESGRY